MAATDRARADRRWMKAALTLAGRGLGRVAPNPAVGCLLVKEDRVIARGWTQPGGRPHAEQVALERAGAAARDATAYVTLEPCAHHGKTPPCAEALIAAGIKRCVVATGDPDVRVAGQGLERLRAAGIEVETGVLEAEARSLNEGFLLNRTAGRPLVTLKLATSLDGKIALASGESKWITGEAARARAHLLRARHDAVLIGSGTALADDPRLDVRLPGMAAYNPLRVVLDRRLRLLLDSDLVKRAHEQPTFVITAEAPNAMKRRELTNRNVLVRPVASSDPASVLKLLGRTGVSRVLIEGGASVATAFLAAGLVDRIAWFRAPLAIGNDGWPALGPLALQQLALAQRFQRTSVEEIGEDLLESYALRP